MVNKSFLCLEPSAPVVTERSEDSLSLNFTLNDGDMAEYTYELSSVAEDGTSKLVMCDKGMKLCILDKLTAARSYAAAITACFTPPKEGKLCSIKGDVSNVWTSPTCKLIKYRHDECYWFSLSPKYLIF